LSRTGVPGWETGTTAVSQPGQINVFVVVWGPACEGGALAWGLVPWGRTRQPAKDDQHSLDETSGQQGDDRRSEGGGPEDVAASATCALPSFVSRARQGSD